MAKKRGNGPQKAQDGPQAVLWSPKDLCPYCGFEKPGETHYERCGDAPEFVKYQALADARYRRGGPFAPVEPYPCGDERDSDRVNRIDRGIPELTCRLCAWKATGIGE